MSQDNNVVPKKEMKRRSYYSNTKVKTRNLLTNVSYKRFKQSDFDNPSFIVDILSFLAQNFNPINLDIKIDMEKRIYFKIEKVRGKTDKENFDAKRTLEDGASDAGSSEFFADSESEQNGAGTKRYGDSFEHLFRKYSITARPKFVAG